MNDVKLIYIEKNVKSKKTQKDVKVREFYILLKNGNYLRINSYSYENKKKEIVDNQRELMLIAVKLNSLDEIKELPF